METVFSWYLDHQELRKASISDISGEPGSHSPWAHLPEVVFQSKGFRVVVPADLGSTWLCLAQAAHRHGLPTAGQRHHCLLFLPHSCATMASLPPSLETRVATPPLPCFRDDSDGLAGPGCGTCGQLDKGHMSYLHPKSLCVLCAKAFRSRHQGDQAKNQPGLVV